MRMQIRDAKGLDGLSPSLNDSPQFIIGNNVLNNKQTSGDNQLTRATNVSLKMKVEGGDKLTTPPKVKKQTKRIKNDYEGKSNIHQQQHSTESTEALLSSLEPYFNNEDLKGLNEETVRQLLLDHPELAEAAREYEKARSNRQHSTKETRKSKLKERQRGSKLNSSGSEYIKYEDSNSNKIDATPNLDVMMEAGIPFKSWFFLCVLIGASILQLRKLMSEPITNKRSSKKKVKNQKYDTLHNKRQLNKMRKIHSKNQQNKENNQTNNKFRLKNNNMYPIPSKQNTREITSNGHNNKMDVPSQPKTKHSKTNNKKKRIKKTIVEDVHVEESKMEKSEIKEESEKNHGNGDHNPRQLPLKKSKIPTSTNHEKQRIHNINVSTQDPLNEYCEEDRRAIMEVLEEDSSNSEGAWQVAGRKHNKNKQKPEPKDADFQKSDETLNCNPSITISSQVENVDKDVTPATTTYDLKCPSGFGEIADLPIDSKSPADSDNVNAGDLMEENDKSILNKETIDFKCPSRLGEIMDPPVDPEPTADSGHINANDLKEENDQNILNKETTVKKKNEPQLSTAKLNAEELQIDKSSGRNGTDQNRLSQGGSDTNENISFTSSRTEVTSHINTQDDAALAVQLQHEEDKLFVTENTTEEQWTTVKTKKNKKSVVTM